MTKLYTYDSKDISILLGGLEMTGFGPDTKVVINREDDLITRTKGVDGELLINRQNMRDGTMTVTLLYGSTWDTALDQLAEARAVVPVAFSHLNSGKVLVSNGWIEQQPDINLGTEAESREWVIGLQSTDFSVGGVASSTFDALERIGEQLNAIEV